MLNFLVIIPVYNVELFLKACIKSVLMQSYQNFQIILVDDGSSDGSGKICDEFQLEDSRIHTIHKKNEGQLSARLTGLRFATKNLSLEDGFIIHLDADDLLPQGTFQRLKTIINSSNCDSVIFTMKGFKNGSIVEDIGWTNIYEGTVTDKGQLFTIILTDNKYNSLCVKTFSTKLIPYKVLYDMSDLFSVKHGEDLIESLLFLENSKKVVFVKDKLYIYRFNENSVSRKEEPIESIVNFKGQQFVWNFINQQQVWGKKELEQYIAYSKYLLRDRLIRVISRKNENEVRYALNAMNENDYCNMLILNSSNNDNDVLLKLLHKRRICLLVNYGKLRRKASSIKHFLKKEKF